MSRPPTPQDPAPGPEDQLILVVGGGKYGTRALEYGHDRGARTVIIDRDPTAPAARRANHRITPAEVESVGPGESGFLEAEATVVLELLEEETPHYVFTAVPLHLAALLARERAQKWGLDYGPWEEGLEEILTGLPPRVVHQSGEGMVIASYMPPGESCVEDCLSPYRCPVTRTVKPAPLYALFQYAASNLPTTVILESEQLKPGLGAIRGEKVRELLGIVDRRPRSLVVGTACRCHGVLHALKD